MVKIKSKVVLRIDISLIRCFAKPFHRFCIILCHALAMVITKSKVVLRIDITLIRCFSIPFHRFCVILRHALAFVIANSKVELRNCISCFCLGFGILKQFAIGVALLCVQLDASKQNQQ